MNELIREQILAMPAGRVMDALVVERVMGYTIDYEFEEPQIKELRDKYDEWGMIPCYSTDIAAAWQVVEKLRLFVMPWGDDEWCVSHERDKHLAFQNIVPAPSAPLAISRAALLATLEATL
jgi:hypothetical protein